MFAFLTPPSPEPASKMWCHAHLFPPPWTSVVPPSSSSALPLLFCFRHPKPPLRSLISPSPTFLWSQVITKYQHLISLSYSALRIPPSFDPASTSTSYHCETPLTSSPPPLLPRNPSASQFSTTSTTTTTTHYLLLLLCQWNSLVSQWNEEKSGKYDQNKQWVKHRNP